MDIALCSVWADFVLVWEENLDDGPRAEQSGDNSHNSHRIWREEFLSRLQAAGLQQELVSEAATEGAVHFVIS